MASKKKAQKALLNFSAALYIQCTAWINCMKNTYIKLENVKIQDEALGVRKISTVPVHLNESAASLL